MRWVDRVREIWRGKPLVTRMVGLIIVLLAFGLTLAGTAMIGLLQRHLITQIDDQLLSSASSLLTQTTDTNSGASGGQPNVPTQYYIRRSMVNGQTQIQASPETLERYGKPQIPELLPIGTYARTDNGWTHPVTVRSTRTGSTWRAVSIPLVLENTMTPAGVMTIALPLGDVQRTLYNTAAYFLVVSIVIVVAGGWLGQYLVRRSLSPLRSIESVAGKIAAGDLTQRVDPEPPTTEVGSLALSLNTMLTQVEQSFEAREATERKIRRFVSDASHELRTPLAAIRGYGELYTMGGVPPERTAEVMGRIQSEATRMGSLVEDLVTLARLDEGRPLAIADVDLVKLADNAAFDLQALDPTRSVRITSLAGRRPPMTLVVPAERDRIQQVFTNLIGNIDRYTPKGSPVELALGMLDHTAVVEFRDHGPGIAAKDQDRVFERFYRAEDSRNRSLGGSGLGLAIVSGILTAHHGRATLTRTRGGGLTVRIELPLATLSQQAESPSCAAPSPAQSPSATPPPSPAPSPPPSPAPSFRPPPREADPAEPTAGATPPRPADTPPSPSAATQPPPARSGEDDHPL